MVPYLNQLALLGKVISTLDHLSKGRLVFGATLAWCSEEFEALGVELESRHQRLEEGIEVLCALWERRAAPVREKRSHSTLSVCSQSPDTHQCRSSLEIVLIGHFAVLPIHRDGWLSEKFSPEEPIANMATFCPRESRYLLYEQVISRSR